MDVLLAFGLPGGLFLVLELLWCRRPEPGPPGDVADEWARRKAQSLEVTAWDPFALPFVRQRLDVVGEELERLVTDETIYGRAFRYGVAKSAYDALLADAIRLAAAARVVPLTAGETTATTLSEATMTGVAPIETGMPPIDAAGAGSEWAPSYEVLEV